MGCIYSNFDGECQNYDEEVKDETLGCVGYGDEDGFCAVEDDPDPNYGCSCYESDSTCSECGADLNTDECSCEEE
jgi:hypothetical protein